MLFLAIVVFTCRGEKVLVVSLAKFLGLETPSNQIMVIDQFENHQLHTDRNIAGI